MLVRGAQSPGEALNVRGRGVQRDVDEVVLGCGCGDSSDGPDFGVGQPALGEFRSRPRQHHQGPGYPDVFPRGA